MRIVFMGTPDFAVPTLKALTASHHHVIAVYSQQDKPKGRGQKMQLTPVKEFALTQNIPVYQPPHFKEEATVEQLRRLKPDCIVVVAYGRILPKSVLEMPKYGCINIHGSLLPKYRGAAPIQWAVLNGEKHTGITTMYMGEGIDTGDILLQTETDIGQNETSGELFDRLKLIGADLLLETLDKLEAKQLVPQKQNQADVTYAPLLTRDLSEIHWDSSAQTIQNQIRGLNPWPCASSLYQGKRIKIFSAHVVEQTGKPGTVFCENGSFCVYCGENALVLLELQPENGKRMSGKSFLLGHPISTETHFDR